MGTQIDIYSLIGIALVCIPCTAWYGILRAHYLTLKAGSLRVQVLTARIALFLPTYALLLWLSLTFPSLFGVLEAPIAIAEGRLQYTVMYTHISHHLLTIHIYNRLILLWILCYDYCKLRRTRYVSQDHEISRP